MYNSYQIANFFIRASQNTGKELTPMKLIKLSYIAHGWHLSIYDTELLDETIYAWKYGPVVDSIYQNFKQYGNGQIDQLYCYSSHNGYPLPGAEVEPFLNRVWEAYGDYNGIQLSAMTHQSNTPWDIVWNRNGGKNRSYAIIPNDLIKSHYKEKIKAVNAQRAATAATA